MKRFFKILICLIIFVIILVSILLKVGEFLVPEWNDEWGNTSIVKNFYALEKNSIDVLAVGSSHVIKGFSALELFENYGISAYGLGTEQQSLMNSLAWIKESQKTQNEKIVLLEAHMFFEQTPEAQNRKGMDNMKLSWNKIQCAYYDSKQRNSFENFVSLIFPITRYHSRWSEVINSVGEKKEIYPNYRGYAFSNEICGNKDYKTLDETIKTEKEFFWDYEKLLEKTIKYCKSKNIELIIYKGPDMDWDMERHNAVARVAKENDITFLDFNLKDLSEEIQFDYANDCEYLNHTNIFGAEKVSNYLGKYISENYEISDKRNDPNYDYLVDEEKTYNYVKENGKIVTYFEPVEYIDALKSEDFTVVYVKNYNMNDGNDKFRNLIDRLGFNYDKVSQPNYCAIYENGQIVYEEGANSNIHVERKIGNFNNLVVNTENMSIKFNDKEQSLLQPGFNIFIYNNKTNSIVENSFISYHNGNTTMGR